VRTNSIRKTLLKEGIVLQYEPIKQPVLNNQSFLFFTLFPTQIAKIRVMIPKIMLFHKAPELLAKLYTQGEKNNQIPIKPESHSCHIQYRLLPTEICTLEYLLYPIQFLKKVYLNVKFHY
jgi:hypothetical protein